MSHRRFLFLSALACCISSANNAGAQAASGSGFAVDRFDPSERGSDWFVVESLDLRGDGRLAVGVVGDWGHRPLVSYREDGSSSHAIVNDQIVAHAGAALVAWDLVRFGLNVPLVLHQEGEAAVVGGTTLSSTNATTVGDLRLGADVRLGGRYGDPLTAALGLAFYVPTGSREAFTGDGKVRVGPRLLIAGRGGDFAYALRMGLTYRALNDDFAGTPLGTEVPFGAAAGLWISDVALIGPELYGSTQVSSSEAFFARRTTPLELLLGAHVRLGSEWRLGAGAGPGLTRGLGSPAVRGLVSLEWAKDVERPVPPPPVLDRDHDGIVDGDDACPDDPGVRTSDPKTNGCPPPKDRDGDTILDVEDACPDEPGVRTSDPKTNGCPPPKDRDGDTILDVEDACPDEPGVRTSDPKTNGCPPPKDRDGDGIPDPEDACPDAAGPKDPDPKKNGCPPARIEKGQIKIIEQVKFKTGSAEILRDSDPILFAVLRIFVDHPEIKKVSVEGHTDNKGTKAYNMNLSRNRAASVARWLTVHGIDKKRLDSKGFGFDKPLDTNDTDEGRRNNRRVEFIIVEPAGGDSPP
jgi:outer membrane protein OmpA-like peptidoglycan-associated protein